MTRSPLGAALIAGALACLLLSACRAERGEPPPAPSKLELVPAAPGALGARAAGTDAAPPPPSEQPQAASPEEDDEDEEKPDAGLLAADAGPGVAL